GLWSVPAVAGGGDEWDVGVVGEARRAVGGWGGEGAECWRAEAVGDEVRTTAETGRDLKVAPRTLYRYIQEKRVPAFKLGKDWRFVKSELHICLRGKSREYTRKKTR